MIEDYYHKSLQGNVFSTIATGAGAGAAVATSLVSAGVAAQAVPVVGQILGGLAIVAGFIASSQAKSKAIKAQGSEVDKANVELIAQNAELDDMISQSQRQIQSINSEITRLGLSGLNGFTDFLKKTFTPAKYQQGILEDKVAANQRLTKEAEQKVTVLQGYQKQLQTLYDKLTGGKTIQRTLLIGGSVAVGLTILYFLNDHFKWIKL